MSLSTVDRNAYSLLKLTAQSGGDYYPEVLGPYIVVNCPSFFSFIWAILKGLVDEKTRLKFKLLGSDYKDELLKLIDADQLPKFLGGTC